MNQFPSTVRNFHGQDEAAKSRAPDQPGTRRLNINLPRHVFEELEHLARGSGRTMTEVVRVAIGLAAVALAEDQNGNKLVIVNGNGELLKEVILPR